MKQSELLPASCQHCVPSQRDPLLTLHNFLGSLHIRPICLTWNNGTDRYAYADTVSMVKISCPVMQNPSKLPGLCHHIGFTLGIRNALVWPTNTPLLFFGQAAALAHSLLD